MATRSQSTKLTFFIGKGGVGKTTVSTAYALHASSRRGRRVVLISTDPAHSLADVLDTSLKSGMQKLRGAGPGTLHVWQVNAGARFQEFLDEYREAITALVEQGTFLSRDEIESFLETTLPGLAEVSALMTISDLLESGKFDEIVVDTAPIGHTLQLFRIPTQLARFLDFLELSGQRDQVLAQHFGGAASGSRPKVLEQWDAVLSSLRSALSTEQSKLVMVTSAERFSLEEASRTARILAKDADAGIAEVVLNRVVARATNCERCKKRAREYEAAKKFVKRRFPNAEIRTGEDPGSPILGVDNLRLFGQHLFSNKPLTRLERSTGFSRSQENRSLRGLGRGTALAKRSRAIKGTKKSPALAAEVRTGGVLSKTSRRPKPVPEIKLKPTHWPVPKTRLTLTLGKGGVGKTTISGGLAYKRRKTNPKIDLLICSTDPAPSLDDLFQQEVTDTPRPVLKDKHFQAVEIDSTAEYVAWSHKVKRVISQSLEMQQGGLHVELSFEHEMISALLDIVPPGVDEIFAVFKLLDFIEARKLTLVIDMAPTGHALELLRTPERLVVWTRLLLKSLAAHRKLPLAQELAVEVASISQRARELVGLLKDQKDTSIFVVMLPEPLPDRQTGRLLESLRDLSLIPSAVFVNRVLPARLAIKCLRCIRAREWQMATLARLRTDTIQHYAVPDFAGQIAGAAGLRRLTKSLWEIAERANTKGTKATERGHGD
jgi:arsenite-transporting ATPase